VIAEHVEALEGALSELVTETKFITFRLAVINQKIENITERMKQILTEPEPESDLLTRAESM